MAGRPTRIFTGAESAFLKAWAESNPDSGSNKGRLEAMAALFKIDPAHARKLLKYRRHRGHYLNLRQVKK